MTKCHICKREVGDKNTRKVCKECREQAFGINEDRKIREETEREENRGTPGESGRIMSEANNP